MEHVQAESAKDEHENCFFQKRDPWGHGSALWVMVLLIFLAPLAISSLRHIRLENNVESWLPDNDPATVEYNWCRDHFPNQEMLILTWEGSTINDPRLPILLGKLQGKIEEDGELRGGLPYVDSVIHAGDVIHKMVEHGVDPQEAIRRLEGTFIGTGRIKVRLTDAGKEERERTIQLIKDDAKTMLDIDLVITESVRQWQPNLTQEELFEALYLTYLPEQTLNENGEETEPLAAVMPVHDFQISWKGMSGQSEKIPQLITLVKNELGFGTSEEPQGRRLVDDCFQAVGSPISVMIALSSAGVADKIVAIEAIRKVATDSFIPAEQLILGGRMVAGAELNAGVIKAAWDPGAEVWYKKSVILLSGLVGILFALISLRSLRLGVLVIGISYYAALLGMSLVPLSGGSMNMVLVVMPTLLMVLSLSGGIHVANYWKHAVWEDPSRAVSIATKMARTPCLMAAFTTALGFISLAGSQLSPVRSFGIYSAIGTVVSVGMVLYGLPAFLQLLPLRRVKPEEVNPQIWLNYGAFVCRRWGLLSIATICISIVCSLGLYMFQVETKIIKYFPDHSEIVQSYQHIEDTLAGITPVEIIVRFDQAAQQKLRFLERLEVVRAVEENIRKHPEVSGAISLADFQPVRTVPGEDASTRDKIFYNRRSNETEKRIKEHETEGASEFLAMTKYMSSPALTVPQGADELWRINAQAAALSDADYSHLTEELGACVQSVTKYHPGTTHIVTGTVPLFLRTQKAVLSSMIWSSGMAFCLIGLVMVFVLKDVLAGILSMVPNFLPVISVFGLISWFGQRVDVGTMVTASVALGIAVDGTLHLLTWFRNGLRKGYSRRKSVVIALSHCAPAMWQTSAAVGIGLLVLLPADLLLISRFGWVMASLIAAALIGDLVLLPSLLVGPLGMIIERRVTGRVALTAEVAEVEKDNFESVKPAPAPHFKITARPRKHSKR